MKKKIKKMVISSIKNKRKQNAVAEHRCSSIVYGADAHTTMLKFRLLNRVGESVSLIAAMNILQETTNQSHGSLTRGKKKYGNLKDNENTPRTRASAYRIRNGTAS